jgi:hypothetical protein
MCNLQLQQDKLEQLENTAWEHAGNGRRSWRYDTQHNDIQHNDIQHNDIQHIIK